MQRGLQCEDAIVTLSISVDSKTWTNKEDVVNLNTKIHGKHFLSLLFLLFCWN